MSNFLTILQDIFPNTTRDIITDIIDIVEEQAPNDTFEGKIENMINLLSGDGAQGPIPEIIINNQQTNEKLYQDLSKLLPNASSEFLVNYCQIKNDVSLEEALDDLLQSGYVQVELDPLVIWEQLKIALPNADPSYLKKEANRLVNLTQQDVDDFVQNSIEQNDYPTMQDYLKNKKESVEVEFYISKFQVQKFLEILPNAVELFSDPNRQLILDDNSSEEDLKFAQTFLCNQYPFIRKRHIEQLVKWRKRNLVEICDRLDRLPKSMRLPRSIESCEHIKNIALLQLITYLKHRKLIKRALKLKDEHYRLAKEEARCYNLLETCQCCFLDELIPEECYFCIKGCIFCKDCVRLGAEDAIGKGEIKFPCLTNCNSEFSYRILQMVLPTKIFERLTQRICSEEIKKANVDGLEICPFCDFAMIIPENEKIFKCINEDCLIESCRECRRKSHIPQRCNEFEDDEDVRRRTYIENKMTEALTRTCYNCNKSFIKTNGCNKMTCICGAKMCYLCSMAVNNYSHFGDGTGRCPLYTNDNEINLNRILRNAQQARNDLGNVEIRFDPATNIRDYY